MAIVLLLASDSSHASDRVFKAQESTTPVTYNWAGWYFGGHLAYGRGSARSSIFEPDPTAWTNSFGTMFGGAQIGYNYLLPSRYLVGLEADVDFPNFLAADDVVSFRTNAAVDRARKVDSIATLRARFGYSSQHWLLYTTAGVAITQARFLQTPGEIEDQDKVLRLKSGPAAGVGAEIGITRDWNARLEYLYSHFGNVSAEFSSGVRYESSFSMHMVRLGLNRPLFGTEGSSTRVTEKNNPWAEGRNWNIHGQTTLVGQGYWHFRSPYEGPNSLTGANQAKNTGSATAFIGLRPWEGGEFYINPELMQGFGLSDVHGVAAFPNGEAQKSSFPIPRLNVARVFLRQTFGLGGEREVIEDGPNQLPGTQDISRITVTVGKFAVPDLFNGNAYAYDPRTTFLNWNIYGGGSYDWTMDKLSWTWGAAVELNQKSWAFRAGYFLLPVESNANAFDTHIPDRGQYTAELELRYSLFSQPGKLRVFGWLNHGIMGGYLDAIAQPVTTPEYPDITLTRKMRTNYGIVVSAEQGITADLGVFSRASWSPGRVEIMGWTDCSESLSFGSVLKGTAWGRPNDKIGLAGVIEGLSAEARAYFASGGLGILIGDGRLNYREEKVLETYYAFAFNKWTTLTFDYQVVVNPGYNADRGPVSVYSARFHAEF